MTLDALRALAEYTRSLEEELDGPEAGEGEALIAANAIIADYGDDSDEAVQWGECPEGGPHRASLTFCSKCGEFDPA